MRCCPRRPTPPRRYWQRSQLNELLAEDRQFYLIELEATYQGEESEERAIGLLMSAVGDSAVSYSGWAGPCGPIPGQIDEWAEVFPGGTQIGNVCWQVQSVDADSLVLVVEHVFSLDEERAYLALR